MIDLTYSDAAMITDVFSTLPVDTKFEINGLI